MKNVFRLFVVAVTLLMVSAVFVTNASAKKDPFVGHWKSTDIDGSYQTLTIGGGPGSSYHVRYYDYGATVCGLDPDTGEFLYAASAAGTLALSAGVLSGTMPVYCQTAPPSFFSSASFEYTYDSATDTLVDSFGVVWSH